VSGQTLFILLFVVLLLVAGWSWLYIGELLIERREAKDREARLRAIWGRRS